MPNEHEDGIRADPSILLFAWREALLEEIQQCDTHRIVVRHRYDHSANGGSPGVTVGMEAFCQEVSGVAAVERKVWNVILDSQYVDMPNLARSIVRWLCSGEETLGI